MEGPETVNRALGINQPLANLKVLVNPLSQPLAKVLVNPLALAKVLVNP
jgi:hypothetical protein